MKNQKYYSMLVRKDGVWHVQFGSYDKSDVLFEIQDMKDHGEKNKNLKWIETTDRMDEIDAAVDKLNGLEAA